MSSRERALQIKILDLETELRKKNEEQNQLVGKMSTVSTEWRVLKVSTNMHALERGYTHASERGYTHALERVRMPRSGCACLGARVHAGGSGFHFAITIRNGKYSKCKRVPLSLLCSFSHMTSKSPQAIRAQQVSPAAQGRLHMEAT